METIRKIVTFVRTFAHPIIILIVVGVVYLGFLSLKKEEPQPQRKACEISIEHLVLTGSCELKKSPQGVVYLGFYQEDELAVILMVTGIGTGEVMYVSERIGRLLASRGT